MKVTVSVFGRFHAFDLALQLQKRGFLETLISTYSKLEITKYGIEPSLIHSLVNLEIMARAWQRVPRLLKGERNLQLWFHERFDRAARNFISTESELFVGWSSLCLDSLRRAKELGALAVVDRGSCHMAYQTQIMQEEYERWGMKFTATHSGVYERELQEYAEADRIAIPSLFVKRTFLERGVPESKLIHVPYGTSLKQFYPVPKEDNIFRIIHCGGITLRKGVQYLLQAFYELKLPGAELWLVGRVCPDFFLSQYKSDSIIIKSKQHQNKLRWFYSQCSVLCLASIEDGFGMVIPQAMACGLPVIHTTNTGGEDIVRAGVDGFSVPIRDVEALKEKILFFYENPDRLADMGKNALVQARKSLSWDDYGEKMVTAYQSALAKR
ncbi:MAG: glycosyltransferase family 4 protein [Oscillatoria princeps RMCB-10]|jgi:glycosyltransferase involved in cell wall biosynthesis|nr:glycosyltransferase family 4 protein [Oscillatoria princeps RMCB-10]